MEKFKIIGIGNAITDILCKVDDDFINKLSISKGSMNLVDEKFLENLKNIKIDKFCSGGSVGNTIATLAQLGNEVDFIGNVANDIAGKNFIDDIQKHGANYCGSIENNKKTASSFIFITPDAQRTMCTFLGCASNLQDSILDQSIFSDAKILYIEGYLWDSLPTIESLKKAINLAKKNKTKIAFSLSDSFCVERHRQDFIALIKNEVDIIFANEDEIMKLLEINNFDWQIVFDFFNKINSNATIAITRSEKGCLVIQHNKIQEFPTKFINNLVDTTGAGDNFASGFLHHFVRNHDIEICAKFGNFLAGNIIQKIGARFESQEIQQFITKNNS